MLRLYLGHDSACSGILTLGSGKSGSYSYPETKTEPA